MPGTTERAIIEIRIVGADKASNEFKQFQNTATRSMSTAEKSVVDSLKSMAAQYLSVGLAIRQATKAMSTGVGFNKFIENQTMSFSVMMKSAEGAKKQIQDLYNFAVNSPLTFKETTGSAKQLMAYGFAAKELVPTMKTLGTVAIATGNRLDDIAYVYGTLRSQGRAYSRDLLQFGMRGIPIYEELAKVMGVNADQIQKMASEGKIGFAEVEKAFQNMTSGSGRFAGTIEGYMDTLTGKTAMLTDIWEKAAGNMMSGVSIVLKDLVTGLTDALSDPKFQKNMETLARFLAGAFKQISTAIIFLVENLDKVSAVLAIIATYKIALLADGFVTAAQGVNIFSAALKALTLANPWLLALTAMVGGIVYFKLLSEGEMEKRKDNAYTYGKIAGAYRQGSAAGEITGTQSQLDFIKVYADLYKRSEAEVAKLLYDERLITAEVAKRAGMYTSQQKAYAEAMAGRSGYGILTEEETQQKFLSELNNKYKAIERIIDGEKTVIQELDMSAYKKSSGDTTAGAKGGKAAQDYLDAINARFESEKIRWGAAWDEDKQKAFMQDAVNSIQNALDTGVDVSGLFSQTNFDEILQGGKVAWQALLDGLGKASKSAISDVISWLEREWQVKVTDTRMDDIALEKDKAIEAARQELLIKMKDEVAYLKTKANIEKYYAQQVSNEIRNIELKRYDEMLNGSSKYWEDLKVKIASGGKVQGLGGLMGGLASGAGGLYAGLGRGVVGLASGAQRTLMGQNIASGYNALKGGTAMGMADTQVGKAIGGDPMLQAGMAVAEFAKSIDGVTKVLNPFTTILEAARPVLEPLLNNVLQPLVYLLEMFGEVIGELFAPIGGLIKIFTTLMYIGLAPLIAILQIVGAVFTWLYDKIIVPVANALVRAVNGVIKAINKALGFLGVHIRYLDELTTMEGLLADSSSHLADAMSYAIDKFNSYIDKQIDSLQDLYDVGAITGASYEEQVKALNASRITTDEDNWKREIDALGSMAEVLQWIKDNAQAYTDATGIGINIPTGNGGTITTTPTPPPAMTYEDLLPRIEAFSRYQASQASHKPFDLSHLGPILDIEQARRAGDIAKIDEILKSHGFAVGTDNLPADMLAQVHQGEMIVPRTFADSIRSGELSLSKGGSEGYGQGINVYVTVEGSVMKENDLADSIAQKIYTRRSRGLLTV